MKILVVTTPPESDIPPGFAGVNIRRQFVGLKIPLAPKEVLAADPPPASMRKESQEGDYLVLRSDAIAALDASGGHDAAEFWRKSNAGRYLLFPREVCGLVASKTIK